jgi:GntR family transcriptional repressor for pyruvate dehydrogenase complex
MHVLNSVHTLFYATIQVALMEFYRQQDTIQTLRDQHAEVLTAIAAHDPELAREKMMIHLAMVEKKMTELLKSRKS